MLQYSGSAAELVYHLSCLYTLSSTLNKIEEKSQPQFQGDSADRGAIDHFTYYCLGSQGGKLWVAMRLLGPIACTKVCRNTAESTENDQSVVLNRRLPVSTFSPNHWSCRCHLLAPHWAEIDRLASGAERARGIKEKKQLAIADAGAAAAAAQSEVREELAEAGKQIEEHKKREEEMERLLASSNVRMPAQKLRSRILSFENMKGNDD